MRARVNTTVLSPSYAAAQPPIPEAPPLSVAPGFNRVVLNATRFSQPFQRFLSRLTPLANGKTVETVPEAAVATRVHPVETGC